MVSRAPVDGASLSGFSEQAFIQLTSAAETLSVVEWNDICVVYQRSSGETHAFNDVAVSFLHCLRDGAGTVSEIVKRVVIDCFEAEPETMETMRAENFIPLVARLEELGLVERLDAFASHP